MSRIPSYGQHLSSYSSEGVNSYDSNDSDDWKLFDVIGERCNDNDPVVAGEATTTSGVVMDSYTPRDHDHWGQEDSDRCFSLCGHDPVEMFYVGEDDVVGARPTRQRHAHSFISESRLLYTEYRRLNVLRSLVNRFLSKHMSDFYTRFRPSRDFNRHSEITELITARIVSRYRPVKTMNKLTSPVVLLTPPQIAYALLSKHIRILVRLVLPDLRKTPSVTVLLKRAILHSR